MGRKSETRERVRQVAEELAAQGIVPTSRKLLELLGKGSLSTITDELELWQRGPASANRPEKAGALELPPPAAEFGGAFPLLELQGRQIAQLLVNNEKTTNELEAIRIELISLRKTHEEQLAIAYNRYEAVQRHALLQVDEARQNAAQLRERVKQLTSELDTREMAHSGKLQSVREENARLRGMLEAVGLSGDMVGRR
jgi:hypothetical protein